MSTPPIFKSARNWRDNLQVLALRYKEAPSNHLYNQIERSLRPSIRYHASRYTSPTHPFEVNANICRYAIVKALKEYDPTRKRRVMFYSWANMNMKWELGDSYDRKEDKTSLEFLSYEDKDDPTQKRPVKSIIADSIEFAVPHGLFGDQYEALLYKMYLDMVMQRLPVDKQRFLWLCENPKLEWDDIVNIVSGWEGKSVTRQALQQRYATLLKKAIKIAIELELRD